MKTWYYDCSLLSRLFWGESQKQSTFPNQGLAVYFVLYVGNPETPPALRVRLFVLFR